MNTPQRTVSRWQICLLALFLGGVPLFAATFPLPIPTRPTSFPLAVPVPHNLIGDSSTTIEAWGRTNHGQTTVPAGLFDAVQVAAGYYHTVALRRDGTVVAWGMSNFSQSTVPAGLVDVVQVAAGEYHTVVLRRDGTVVAWGYNALGQTTVPAGLVGVVQVAAGREHSVALKHDGTVLRWGAEYEDLKTGPAGLVDVVQVAAGGGFHTDLSTWITTWSDHTVALKRDGTVVAWGDNFNGQTTVPAGLVDVVQVAAGGAHTVALKRDGTVVAWGSNNYGETTVPAGLVGVVQVAAGVDHTVALKRDGTVVAWGRNNFGQTTVPAGLADVVQVAAGSYHTAALKRDGTVVAWGNNGHGQTTVPDGLVGVVQVATGYEHALALKKSRSMQSIRPFALTTNVPFGRVLTFTNTKSTAGLPVRFERVSGPVDIFNNQATITGVGAVVVRAVQAGNRNYNAAVPLTNRFTTVKAGQSIISFVPISKVPFGRVLTFSNTKSTAGLPVSFERVSGPVAVVNNRATITGVGAVVVRAVQAGNRNYNAAVPLTNRFTTVKARQSITFTSLPPTATFRLNGSIPLGARSSSGLAVTYTSAKSNILQIVGTNAVMKGRGTNMITATQPGSANFLPATSVVRTIVIK